MTSHSTSPPSHPRDLEFDPAIRQKYASPRRDFARQSGKIGRNKRRAPHHFAWRDGQQVRRASVRPACHPSTGPVRILGPCRSCRMQIVRFSLCAAFRIRWMRLACSGWVPWEKLMRATSIPRRMRSAIHSSESHAGPMVQTIFARRPLEPGSGTIDVMSAILCQRFSSPLRRGAFAMPRGKSIALNSAPISTTSEITYIHVRSAMPTPSEP